MNSKAAQRLNQSEKLPKRETFSYYAYFFGQNLIYWLVTNWLMLYYTDYIFIPPLVVSALMLGSKVWDAVNDPLFGIIVDRVNLKGGKFIPWVRIGTILLPVITFMLFIVSPSAPMPVRISMAVISYLLYDLFYTVSDVPIFALTTVMTQNVKLRSKLVSYGRIGAAIGAVFVAIAVPPLIERTGYTMPALIICGICYITMLPICFTAKERFAIPREEKSGMPLRDAYKYLKGNKYLILIFSAICINGMFGINLANYIAKYCLGSLDYVAISTLIAIPFGLLVFILVPQLLKKFDKITIYRAAFIGNIIIAVLAFFAGYKNLVLYFIFVGLKAFTSGILGLLMFTFAADCVEYGHFKTGMRQEGISFSLQTFSAKFMAAISTALAAIVLYFMNYDSKLAIQPDTLPDMFWNWSSWVPIIGALAALPLLFIYKLRDKDLQVMTDCNIGKITREEAETLLSQKY